MTACVERQIKVLTIRRKVPKKFQHGMPSSLSKVIQTMMDEHKVMEHS